MQSELLSTLLSPLDDHIVVKPIEAQAQSEGGILLPSNAKDKPTRGEVVTVGPGRRVDGERIPISVEVGDIVIYGEFAGNAVKVEGLEYKILREGELLAKIDQVQEAANVA